MKIRRLAILIATLAVLAALPATPAHAVVETTDGTSEFGWSEHSLADGEEALSSAISKFACRNKGEVIGGWSVTWSACLERRSTDGRTRSKFRVSFHHPATGQPASGGNVGWNNPSTDCSSPFICYRKTFDTGIAIGGTVPRSASIGYSSTVAYSSFGCRVSNGNVYGEGRVWIRTPGGTKAFIGRYTLNGQTFTARQWFTNNANPNDCVY